MQTLFSPLSHLSQRHAYLYGRGGKVRTDPQAALFLPPCRLRGAKSQGGVQCGMALAKGCALQRHPEAGHTWAPIRVCEDGTRGGALAATRTGQAMSFR